MPPTNIAKIRHPQILTAPTNRAATPPSLRPVIVGQLLPDPSVGHSYEAQGYVRILGGQPNKPVTPPTYWSPLQVSGAASAGMAGQRGAVLSADESNSKDQRAENGQVIQLGGKPNNPVTPPRPTLITQANSGGGQGYAGPMSGQEDLISFSVPPSGTILTTYGAKLAKPQTPIIVSGAGDSNSVLGTEDLLSQPYPPYGVILGGRPNKAVTPPSPQEVLIASGAGDTSSTFPGANGIEDTYSLPYPPFGVILGGLPNAPVTPRSLRTVTLAQPVEQTVSPDVFTPASAAPRRSEGLALVLGGKPSFSVTPPSLRPVLVFAEPPSPDYSVPPQFLVKTYVKPAAAVGIASIQPIIARADDSLVASYIPGPYNIQAPASGISALYLCSTASSTVGTDNTLVTTPPSPETSNSTSTLGTGWFILWAQGTIGGSGGGTEPGQNDEGFLWDVTTLEGQTLKAGNYSATVKLSSNGGSTGGNGVDIHVRVAKRNSTGTIYTPIVDLVLTGQTITTTATVFHIPAAAGPAINFGVGDKLYVDVLLNVSNTGTATGFKLFQNGGVNESLSIPANVGTVSVIVPRVVTPVVATEDPVYQGRPAEAFRYGGLPSRGATPPSLRNVLRVDPPDTEPVAYWQRANETFITGGLPSRGVTPPSLRTPQIVLAEDVLSFSVPPYGTVLRRLGTLPSVTIANKPFVALAEDVLTPPRHPEGMVLGGRPSRPITPPSLRPVVYSVTAEDIYSPLRHPEGLAIVERKAQGASQMLPAPLIVLAEDTLSRERPPPYATILYANVRAVQAPPQRPLQSAPEDQSPWYVPSAQVWRNPFTTVVNLPEIPPPPINARPDDSLAVTYTPPVVLWTRPNRPTVHPSALIPGLVTTEDVYSPQEGRAQVYRTARFPPGGPPSLRTVVSAPSEEQGVLYTGRSAGEVVIVVIVPVPPVTPQALRAPLVVVPEDTVSLLVPATTSVWRTVIFQPKHWQPVVSYTPDVLSEQVPAEGRVLGGRAGANVTPRTLRRPMVVLAEDPTPLPHHPEGTVLGGTPNAPAGPQTLRPVIYATTEDVISFQRNPEAWLLAGPNISPVRGLPRQITVTADDVLSPQRLPGPFVLGGRPNRPVTPRSLRPALVVPQEDVLSRVPPPSFTYGGRPSRAVTPQTLREIVVAGTPDVYTIQNVPPPVLLQGYPHTIISQVPVTKLQDVYAPVIKIRGKVGGTTNG